jgi:hypothetical protein
MQSAVQINEHLFSDITKMLWSAFSQRVLASLNKAFKHMSMTFVSRLQRTYMYRAPVDRKLPGMFTDKDVVSYHKQFFGMFLKCL